MKQNWRATYFLPFCQMDNKIVGKGEVGKLIKIFSCMLPGVTFQIIIFTKDRVYYKLRT